MICPLCYAEETHDFSRDARCEYLRCPTCGLVFVPPHQLLSADDERKRYDLHRNDPADAGYRNFLSRMVTALKPHLAPGSRGLDFGSGPEPLLARLLSEAGHSMTIYDPFYEPDPAPLARQYDFITATEVVEHLREPGRELDRLWSCLVPGGRLGIMTRPYPAQDAFPAWHYKNDPTHICFFSRETFGWLAGTWGAELSFPENDIVLLLKK